MDEQTKPDELQRILSPDEKARHRGRLGLAIPWEHMPWWVIITAIIAVFVFFSIVNNDYYRNAFYFIFDLPQGMSGAGPPAAAPTGGIG